MSHDLEAIAARANAATPGEWRLTKSGERIIQTQHITRDVWEIPRSDADMVFIAHARADVPALVAEVKRLRALVKDAECQGAEPHSTRANCPWCGYAPGAYKRSHAPECAAFTEGGEVR